MAQNFYHEFSNILLLLKSKDMPIHAQGQSNKNGRVVESRTYLRLPCIQRDRDATIREVCEREPHYAKNS